MTGTRRRTLQVVIRNHGRELEVDVDVRVPDATVGDLLAAVGRDDEAPGVDVDGRFAHRDLSLDEAGLHDGAIVEPCDPHPAPERIAEGDVVLAVAGGLDAGARHPLWAGGGSYVIGRGPDADVVIDHPTVSAHHAIVRVDGREAATIEDCGSSNGTWVDGCPVTGPTAVTPASHLRFGAVGVRIEPAARDDEPLGLDPLRLVGLGNVPFNRPPRSAPPPEPAAVTPPERPPAAPTKPVFSPIALLAPIGLAVVLVVVLGSFRYAIFMIFSPLMIVGNYVEGRRRHTRGSREEREHQQRELTRFRTALDAARTHATHRAREVSPHPAELVRWVTQPSVRLWERRRQDADWLRLHAGIGDVAWTPPLAGSSGGLTGRRPDLDDDAARVLEERSHLPQVPVPVDLADGGVVGIVGGRGARLAVARWLTCEAVTQHGPADLPAVIATDRPDDWDWAKWLPHVRTTDGGRRLAGDRATADTLLTALVAAGDPETPGPTLLVIIDDPSVIEGRNAPARTLLRGAAGPVAGVVLAETADQLPAMCTTVIAMDGVDGAAQLHRPGTTRERAELVAHGLAEPTARHVARRLAGFDDPELVLPGGLLPDRVDLVALLDGDPFDPEQILRWWQAGGDDPGVHGPLGVSEQGVFTVDLDRDGPHGLMGGTTGSGKSELLRSLVASCSLHADPDHLTWVLIDYKGGSAFDVCARLPHTVGMVTNLDPYLGERALRCLNAELHHRERVLREAGASDLATYVRMPIARERPLPRLVVVIDEFAQLRNEMPEFVDALVGIAQVGRSLGVHLLLATQRPTGAVNDNIRANTNLRISLRMQDAGDSTDIIGSKAAAELPRERKGRGYVRLGPSEVVPIQTALVTGVSGAEGAAVAASPFVFGPGGRAPTGGGPAPDAPSDLERVVAAVGEAFDATGATAPREPWPEPLPHEVPLDDLLATAEREGPRRPDEVTIALADDPEAQGQYPVGWDLADGNLLLFGLVGSGTTSTLAAIACSLAATRSPDDCHLYVLEFGASQLGPLAELPHCGVVVGPSERERQLRTLRFLRDELARRQALDATERRDEPTVVLVLDGYAAFAKEFDTAATRDVIDDVQRLIADGAAVGVHAVLTGARAGAIPSMVAANVAQKWLLRLADKQDVATFGVLARTVPDDQPPGRVIVAATGQHAQVGWVGDLAATVRRIAERAASPARPPRSFGVLPRQVGVATLADRLVVDREPWQLPVGVAAADLGPAVLRLYDGEHVTVAGPARSGKSSLLAALARMLVDAGLPVSVYSPRRSPVTHVDGVSVLDAPADLAAAVAVDGHDGAARVVMIDDAAGMDDPRGAIAGALQAAPPGLRLCIAGRADGLRSGYGHWTQTVRRSRAGVLLQPDLDLDGDLLGVALPRQVTTPLTVGRGWVVSDGDAEIIQAASPDGPR